MDGESPYSHTLKRAAEIIGGEAQLADSLMVSRRDLSRWIAGLELPSLEVHILALDIIARGSYGRT